jgi:hypothetical protein
LTAEDTNISASDYYFCAPAMLMKSPEMIAAGQMQASGSRAQQIALRRGIEPVPVAVQHRIDAIVDPMRAGLRLAACGLACGIAQSNGVAPSAKLHMTDLRQPRTTCRAISISTDARRLFAN